MARQGGISVCWSPDGRFVAGADFDSDMVAVWDASTGKEIFKLDNRKIYYGRNSIGCWSPDGKYIVVGKDVNALEVFDSRTGKLVYDKKDLGCGLSAESFSPDGKFLSIGGRSIDHYVKIIDVASGKDVLILGSQHLKVEHIETNKETGEIIVKAEEESCRIYDAKSGEKTTSV